MGNSKIPGGYIIISRKIIESEIWDKPPLYTKVWLYLLTRAQHSDFKKMKRGQLFTSIPEIMEACSWKVGYRTVKPTKDQVFQILAWLRKGNEAVHEGVTKATMITTTKATQGLLINIDNYDYYQTSKNYESNDDGTNEEATKATREQRQPDNINKNVLKNEKNDKEDINTSCHKSKIYDVESIPYQLSLRLFNRIKANNDSFKDPNLQKWADDFRLMMDRDKRTQEQIAYLIDWCQQDSFWKANILSPSKLRKQYDHLVVKIKAQKQGKKKSVHDIPMKRPEHWQEPEPLTKEDLRRIEELEKEMPF
jgi:hypothetical protein